MVISEIPRGSWLGTGSVVSRPARCPLLTRDRDNEWLIAVPSVKPSCEIHAALDERFAPRVRRPCGGAGLACLAPGPMARLPLAPREQSDIVDRLPADHPTRLTALSRTWL